MALPLFPLVSGMSRVLSRWIPIAALVALAVSVGEVIRILIASAPAFPRPALVYLTAHWAVGVWVLGSALMIRLPADQWKTWSAARLVVQLAWFVGAWSMLCHVAVAFQHVHDWSHESAFRDTAKTAGVGEGVYVNYLFVAVWLADASWLLGWPTRYANRPRWIRYAVHGFLAFVMFNATVVYGEGMIRWVGIGWFALLAIALWKCLLPRRNPVTRTFHANGF